MLLCVIIFSFAFVVDFRKDGTMLTIQNERIRVKVSITNSTNVLLQIYFIDFDKSIPEDELVDVGSEKLPRFVLDDVLIRLNYSIKGILSGEYYDDDFIKISDSSFLSQIIIEAFELISHISTYYYDYFLKAASS